MAVGMGGAGGNGGLPNPLGALGALQGLALMRSKTQVAKNVLKTLHEKMLSKAKGMSMYTGDCKKQVKLVDRKQNIRLRALYGRRQSLKIMIQDDNNKALFGLQQTIQNVMGKNLDNQMKLKSQMLVKKK